MKEQGCHVPTRLFQTSAPRMTGQGCHVPSRITIKEARCLAAARTKMDLQELERIKADARAMQIMLEIPPTNDSCPRLQAARVNCERILECCERHLRNLAGGNAVFTDPA